MAKMQIKFELQGIFELKEKLGELGGRKVKQILRTAVNYGITPLLAATKRLVPRSTGQLRLSMSKVVRTYPSGVVVGVVGPAKGFRGHFTDKKGRLVLRNPVKYAHLVEYGHRVVHGGKLDRSKYKSTLVRHEGTITGIASPIPFMRPGFLQTEAQVQARMESKIAEGLIKAGA